MPVTYLRLNPPNQKLSKEASHYLQRESCALDSLTRCRKLNQKKWHASQQKNMPMSITKTKLFL